MRRLKHELELGHAFGRLNSNCTANTLSREILKGLKSSI